jgi:hypothetical protein
MKKLVGVTLSLLVSMPAAAGDVYKWRDETGQMHFGDRPPAGARAEHAVVQPTTGGDTAEAGSGLRDGERAWLSEIEKQQRQKQARKRARERMARAAQARREAQAEQDARRCAGYRQKIRDYKNRLRAGCRVSTCNSYDARIARYKSRAELVCH